MKLIPLTKGYYAKVDDQWFDHLVALGPWQAVEKGGNVYAATYSGGGRANPIRVYMHNLVKTPRAFETIDHINHDTLDNQMENLRSATVSQQRANGSLRSDNTSGVPGVSWDKTAKTWRVYTDKDGKRKCLGLRKNLEDAIKLRNEGTVAIHGEFARIYDANGQSVSASEKVN